MKFTKLIIPMLSTLLLLGACGNNTPTNPDNPDKPDGPVNPPQHTHEYVKTSRVDHDEYACSCGEKYLIKDVFNTNEDFSSYADTNSEAGNKCKIKKNTTITWNVTSSEAFEATFAMDLMLTNANHTVRKFFVDSTVGNTTDANEASGEYDGTSRITLKVNGTEHNITNANTYGENGLNVDCFQEVVLARIPLIAGKNTISFTWGNWGFRLYHGGNIKLTKVGEYTYGDGTFSNLSKFDSPIDFHTSAQKDYLNWKPGQGQDFFDIPDSAYPNGDVNISSPTPTRISWKHSALEGLANYNVQLSLNQNFTDYVTYPSTINEYYDLYNLYMGTDNYVRIAANYNNLTTLYSDVIKISTVDSYPRNIHVDGLTNCRDLGGRILSNGSKVKQGLIYRTASLDAITTSGKNMMNNILKIKSEIELRGENSDTTSRLGVGTRFFNLGMDYDKGVSINYVFKNVETLKRVFDVLSDINNYPLIYHCRIGTDRTGLVTFFIKGLLGESIDDIIQDYLFSNFGNIDSKRTLNSGNNSFIDYYEDITKFPGDTLADQITSFLVAAGIPLETLNKVKTILTEGPAVEYDLKHQYVAAKSFELGEGLSLTSSSSKKMPEKYVPSVSGKNFEVDFNVDEAKNYAVVAYLGSKVSDSTPLSNAFSLSMDDNTVSVPTTTYADLGFGNVTSNSQDRMLWIPIIINNVNLTKGQHKLKVNITIGNINFGGFALIEK